jgi:hypothetical protein
VVSALVGSPSSFLYNNIGVLLTGAVGAIMGWITTHAIAKPILQVREKRLEAFQLAERHFRMRSTAPVDEIKCARSAVADVATRMRAFSRARIGAAPLYCWLRGYNLEMAARCLYGLVQMIGDDSFKNMNRQNNLDALHYCLRTDKHLSRTRRKEIKNMLREAECATESDPTRLSSLDRVT